MSNPGARSTGLYRAVWSVALASVLATATFTSVAANERERDDDGDQVVFSFATVGDSRQDPNSPDPTTLLPNNAGVLLPQDHQFLQNTKAFSRILRSVKSERVNLFIENGDIIMGYGRAAVPSAWSAAAPATPAAAVGSDLVRFYTQFAYWRGMVADLFETGTYVLPVPGNHESQCSSSVTTNGAYNAMTNPSGCTSGKHAYPENEDAYRANVGDMIGDLGAGANLRFQSVTGKAPLNATGLTAATAPTASAGNGPINSDQSKMSYSFDVSTSAGLLHFAIINTDPTGADSTAPADWLDSDLAAAQSRGAMKYFVFGHKPAFTYNYVPTPGTPVTGAGLDANLPLRNAFWKTIAKFGATYFCGHEHVFNISQNADPTGTYGGTPYQVLVGSGGSPFDDKLAGTCPACAEPALNAPTDRYYAWAVVRVYRSGAVSLKAWGFDDAFGPTKLLVSVPALQ
jgi:hypothetical protein